jgi:hypothetical protein
VKCKAADELSLEEMTPLQGDLKTLSDENHQKLKSNLVENGFLFPFFIWQNNGENYYLDGHQRDRVLHEMMKEPDKYKLPDKYPVAYIEAKNKKRFSNSSRILI